MKLPARGDNIYIGPLRVYIADEHNNTRVVFVTYKNQSIGSNFRVPAELLGELEKDAAALELELPGVPGSQIDD